MPQRKKIMIEKVADAIFSVEGEGLRPVTRVLIDDVSQGPCGIGVKPVWAQDVPALATGNG